MLDLAVAILRHAGHNSHTGADRNSEKAKISYEV
jgi:hypothetical protein